MNDEFRRLVRRLPFTTVLILSLLTISSIAGVLSRPLSSDQLRHWGFGWEDLISGRVWHLLSAPFLVLRPYMALSITAILLFFVGSCELLLRTKRTIMVFVVSHILGYLGTFVLLRALGRLGWKAAEALTVHGDVGASNGAFGAIGAVLVFLPTTLRTLGFLLLGAYLAGALIVGSQVWDVQHIVALLTGVAFGTLFLKRDSKKQEGRRVTTVVLHRQRPRLMSWFVGGMGVVNVMSAALLPNHPGFERLEGTLPLGLPHGPRMVLLFGGLLQLLVAGSLQRAQRVAWWLAFVLLFLTTILQLILGVTKLEALFAFLFLILLAAWKEDFPAAIDPPSVKAARTRSLGVLLGVPLVSWVSLLALRGLYSDFHGPLAALQDVLRRLVYLTPKLVPLGKRGDWLLEAIPLVFWSGVLLVLAQTLRAVRAPRANPSERSRARKLSLAHGRTGTDFMTTWPGNSYFFGPGNHSYIAYRLHSGIALALGDPVGPASARGETLSAFMDYCRERGWSPAVIAASSAASQIYQERGFLTLPIGEEAVIELGSLVFKGKEWQNMRTALNRARKTGLAFQLVEGGHVPPEIELQMRHIEEDWAKDQGLPPMEFTLGKIDDIHDSEVEVAVAIDAEGKVHGFVDWLPVPERHGWVLDLMKRRRDAMNGTMEYLLGMSLMSFQQRGDRLASLGTAPLAELNRNDDQSLVPSLLRLLFDRFRTLYDFQSLFAFKSRFSPQWEPVYLAYLDPVELPTITLAVLRAHLPKLGWTQAAKLLGSTLVERLQGESEEDL